MLIKGKGRFMQSGKAIRGPYSLIFFLSLLQKLALMHMGLFYEVRGFLMRASSPRCCCLSEASPC